MKSILLVGVGEIGLNQIQWAKDAGFHVIVSDKNPEAPALRHADHAVIIDGSDTRGLVSWAMANMKKLNITAVYSGNDFGVFSSVVFAQALGLRTISTQAVTCGLSKDLMKACWIKDGILTPDFRLVRSEAEAKEACENFGLPIILKPSDSSGSQGLRCVYNDHELESALQNAFQYTRSNTILVEQMIEGRHIDANGFFWENVFYGCGFSERFFSEFPFRVPIGGYEPADLEREQEDELNTVFERAARSLGIDHGPVKADFMLSDKGPQMIELSARFHGDVGTSHLTYHRTGMSLLQVYFKLLFNESVDTDYLKLFLASKRLGCWRVLEAPVGQSRERTGAVIENCSLEGIDEVFVRPRGPQRATSLQNNNDVVGFVWASGEKRDRVEAALQRFIDEFYNKCSS